MSAPLSPPTVAVVEDENDFRADIVVFLQGSGFAVWGVPSAEAFYRQLAARHADVVLADLSLPGECGLSLIAYLRDIGRHGLIAMTDQAGVADRIASLEAGADQYFVKPGNLQELAAGIHAVLRGQARASQRAARRPDPDAQAWELKRETQQLLSPLGHGIDLTGREMELLECLLEEPNCTVPKSRVLATLGGIDQEDYHRVEVLLSRLRRKVEAESGLPLPIRSVFGKGLVFVTIGGRRS